MSQNTNRWTLTVEEDPETGDLVLPFPPDLLSQAGWHEGDTLLWEITENSVFLSKKNEPPTLG